MAAPGFRYNRAPIVEALISISVAPDVEDLDRLGDAGGLVDGYPKRELQVALEGQVRADAGGVSTETRQRHAGFRFVGEDGKQMFLAQGNGFTFGRLAPYDRWGVFSMDAMAAWQAYVSVARPTGASRLSVRYINHIGVPGSEVELSDLFRTYPEVSSDMPSTLSGYFLSMTIPLPEHDANLNLIQTVAEVEEGKRGILLDLEVYREVSLPIDGEGSTSALLEHLGVLRDAKNMVFEACITDDARRLFD